jgi:hypothetical protein
MNIGKVIRPRQTLGAALAANRKPIAPARPMQHRNGPPTMGYHKHHPTLTSAATPAALPVRSTQGVSQTQLGSYLKSLRGY